MYILREMEDSGELSREKQSGAKQSRAEQSRAEERDGRSGRAEQSKAEGKYVVTVGKPKSMVGSLTNLFYLKWMTLES